MAARSWCFVWHRESGSFDKPLDFDQRNYAGVESYLNRSARIGGGDFRNSFLSLQYSLETDGACHAREAFHGPRDTGIRGGRLFPCFQPQKGCARTTASYGPDKLSTMHFPPSMTTQVPLGTLRTRS